MSYQSETIKNPIIIKIGNLLDSNPSENEIKNLLNTINPSECSIKELIDEFEKREYSNMLSSWLHKRSDEG